MQCSYRERTWPVGIWLAALRYGYSQLSVNTQSTLQSTLADVYKNIPFCAFSSKNLRLYIFSIFKVSQAGVRQMVHFYTFQRVLTVVLTEC